MTLRLLSIFGQLQHDRVTSRQTPGYPSSAIGRQTVSSKHPVQRFVMSEVYR